MEIKNKFSRNLKWNSREYFEDGFGKSWENSLELKNILKIVGQL